MYWLIAEMSSWVWVRREELPAATVEAAFRTLKHDLALRPVCHRLEERAEAHVLFCWIAYAMYWVLERTLFDPVDDCSDKKQSSWLLTN